MSDGSTRLAKFDFAFIPADSLESSVQLATLGEQHGYRTLWIPDQGFHRDPFLVLSLCAAVTKRIEIGVGITSPFTRSPVQLARAAGTLDEISSHRFRLGLGTANVAHVLRPMGISFQRPVGRLRDAIHIIRQLLAGKRVEFQGPDDQLSGVQLEFKTRPDIPIYLGTRGQQTLELAGRIADGVLVESLFAGEGFAYALSSIMQGIAVAERKRDTIDVVSWQLVLVTDDPQAMIDAHKSWIARAIQTGPPEAMYRVGIDPEVVKRVADAMNRGDQATAIASVTDAAVRSLMIIGTPQQVIDQITYIFDRGANTVCVLGISTPDVVAQNLIRFARDVMPAFT